MERNTAKEMCKKHFVVFRKECRACKEENLYSARPDFKRRSAPDSKTTGTTHSAMKRNPRRLSTE